MLNTGKGLPKVREAWIKDRLVAGDEQALANGYLEEVTYPDGTKVMMPVPPMFLSNYARRPIVPTGEPGDATSEILKTIGYTEDMIAELRNIKAVK